MDFDLAIGCGLHIALVASSVSSKRSDARSGNRVRAMQLSRGVDRECGGTRRSWRLLQRVQRVQCVQCRCRNGAVVRIRRMDYSVAASRLVERALLFRIPC